MSHVQHHAACITSWDEKTLSECRDRFKAIGLQATDILESCTNGYKTFFVIPSGSKAGWPEEEAHLAKLEAAHQIIRSYEHEDGSNSLDHYLAVYGEHEG